MKKYNFEYTKKVTYGVEITAGSREEAVARFNAGEYKAEDIEEIESEDCADSHGDSSLFVEEEDE